MHTLDYINHAARAMDPDAFADRNPQRPSAELQWAVRRKIATDHAEALDAAGLLVTPEHDAKVAAKGWEEGYGCGVHDERMASDYNVGTTFGVEPCRVNPYEAGGDHE